MKLGCRSPGVRNGSCIEGAFYLGLKPRNWVAYAGARRAMLMCWHWIGKVNPVAGQSVRDPVSETHVEDGAIACTLCRTGMDFYR